MNFVLFGGGGVLGSGFCEVLSVAGQRVVRLSPPWTSSVGACSYIEDQVRSLMGRAGEPVTVIWAAGIGGIRSDPDAMRVERAALSALIATLKRVSGFNEGSRLVLASSAGALFGGHGPTRIDDMTPPVPIATFGYEKLEQESICAELADYTGCRVLLARLSNVYGLADGRLPRRGLIDTAVRAVRTCEPMAIYVSPDSRRDYIYNVDAAQVCLDLVNHIPPGCHHRIVASGDTVSVAGVIGTVSAIARRRVPATFADRPYSSLQPRTLWFRPAALPVARSSTAMPVAIQRMLQAPMSEHARTTTMAPAVSTNPRRRQSSGNLPTSHPGETSWD